MARTKQTARKISEPVDQEITTAAAANQRILTARQQKRIDAAKIVAENIKKARESETPEGFIKAMIQHGYLTATGLSTPLYNRGKSQVRYVVNEADRIIKFSTPASRVSRLPPKEAKTKDPAKRDTLEYEAPAVLPDGKKDPVNTTTKSRQVSRNLYGLKDVMYRTRHVIAFTDPTLKLDNAFDTRLWTEAEESKWKTTKQGHIPHYLNYYTAQPEFDASFAGNGKDMPRWWTGIEANSDNSQPDREQQKKLVRGLLVFIRKQAKVTTNSGHSFYMFLLYLWLLQRYAYVDPGVVTQLRDYWFARIRPLGDTKSDKDAWVEWHGANKALDKKRWIVDV